MRRGCVTPRRNPSRRPASRYRRTVSDIVRNTLSLVDHYAAAIRAGDRAALEALLSPGFRFVSVRGAVLEHADRVAALAAGADDLAAFGFEVLMIQRAADDAVVVTAAYAAEFRSGGEPDHGVASLVFARRAERWRLIHQHNSHRAGDQHQQH
jgi:ketosteroid isomerase-like protein